MTSLCQERNREDTSAIILAGLGGSSGEGVAEDGQRLAGARGRLSPSKLRALKHSLIRLLQRPENHKAKILPNP
jgi:hypothetical protein